MKIAVTSRFPTIDAYVGTKLRSSKYLLIIDLDTMEYEVDSNPFLSLSGPAACNLFAQQLLEKKVSKVLTDNCSRDIRKSLGRVGIQVIRGMRGPVRSVVKKFKKASMADTIIIPIKDTPE